MCTWPPRYQKEVIIEDEGAVQERQRWTQGQRLLSPSIVPSAILVRTNVSLEGRCGAVFLYKPEHRTHSVNLSCLESPCQWDPSQITGLLCVQVVACSILNNNNTVNNKKCRHSVYAGLCNTSIRLQGEMVVTGIGRRQNIQESDLAQPQCSPGHREPEDISKSEHSVTR